MATQTQSNIHLPRVEIKFCVQCKWNLRAAYYAQELLQTFSNTIGEISLVPVTGGTFTITLTHSIASSGPTDIDTPTTNSSNVTTTQIWDRKSDGGFPETKELKNRIRNLIDPQRDMGHVDRALKKDSNVVSSGGGGNGESSSVKEAEKGEVGDKSGEMVKERSGNGDGGHRHAHLEQKGEDGKGIEDCEECRLAARESLEAQIGRVTSGNQ